jgi:hypothetical protein
VGFNVLRALNLHSGKLMPAKTHMELVRDEIVRQWPDRVRARARMMQRPLGHDDVSDKRARELWNQVNPRAAEMIVQSPNLTEWQATKLLYPYREALLQAAKNEGGIKGMIAFERKMSGTRSEGEREEPQNASGY